MPCRVSEDLGLVSLPEKFQQLSLGEESRCGFSPVSVYFSNSTLCFLFLN